MQPDNPVTIKPKIISLLTLMFLLLQGASPATAKTYLVAVGISDYPGKRNDLRLPAKDAQDVVSLYKLNRNCEAVLITDSRATRQNVCSALERTFAKAGENDDVVFFFSGHGIQGAFMLYDGALSNAKVIEKMGKGNKRSKIVISDSCFSGKFRSAYKEKATTEEKTSDVMFFLSSRSDEKSKELRFMNNGLFTTHLLKGLRGYADKNSDRIITAKELFDYVQPRVIKGSRETQHPVMWGRFKDSMPVFSW